MFEPKRTFLFLNQREHSLFMSKRLAFDDSVEDGKKEQAERPDEKKLSPKEKEQVLGDLMTKLPWSEWKTKEPAVKNFDRMAKNLYPKNPEKQKYAAFELNDAFGPASDTEGRADKEKLLQDKKCTSVRIKDGEMKFFDANGKEIEVAQSSVRLKPSEYEPSTEELAERKAKKEAEDAEKAEKERVAKETEEKNKALVAKFQEWFPGKNVKVSGSLAPAPYILNLDPGHADNVYDETEGKTTFSRAFGQIKNPVVAINDGTIVEVEGVEYVKTDQALLKRSAVEKGVVQKKTSG